MAKPILDAGDNIATARDFIRALEMTTRDPKNYADPADAHAVSAVCFAALDRLDAAWSLLTQAMKGGAA